MIRKEKFLVPIKQEIESEPKLSRPSNPALLPLPGTIPKLTNTSLNPETAGAKSKIPPATSTVTASYHSKTFSAPKATAAAKALLLPKSTAAAKTLLPSKSTAAVKTLLPTKSAAAVKALLPPTSTAAVKTPPPKSRPAANASFPPKSTAMAKTKSTTVPRRKGGKSKGKNF